MTISSSALETEKSSQTNAVPPTSKSTESNQESSGGSKFVDLLRQYLEPDSANQVSEEALFAAIVRERIVALKGEEFGTKWDAAFSAQKAAAQKPDGFIPLEDATNATLKEFVASAEITQEESDKIYSQSFAAAQLDSNTGKLWDNRGGGSDTTVAVAVMESALEAARLKIDAFDSGEAVPEVPAGETVDGAVTPNGTTIDGPDGFLFKPVSNNEGRLAVLLPESLAHQVERVLLKDLAGNVLDEGNSTGYGDTGEREKFAFSKKGADYPKDITVEVVMMDGSIRSYSIPDPSQRYD